MSRPISNRMLTCSASLFTKQEIDEDRNIIWEEPIVLEKVYITSTLGQTKGSNGQEPSDTMMLYYDCYNSRPLNITFQKGQKIVFNGTDYFVNSITPCYTDGLHHYEIGLN